jgi:hypothetical protein
MIQPGDRVYRIRDKGPRGDRVVDWDVIIDEYDSRITLAYQEVSFDSGQFSIDRRVLFQIVDEMKARGW